MTGISYSTYWRLERGRYKNPPIGYLMNCSIALGCELEDILEEEQKQWYAFDQQAAAPPDAVGFWRS